MSDASAGLQAAVVQALKASAAVSALVGYRVFDDIPKNAEFPYLSIGTVQILPEIAEGYDGHDEVFTIDGWSRKAVGQEINRIGAAVNAALSGAALSVSGFRLIDLVPEQTNYLRDPDGITRHGVFVYRARLEPA